MQKWRQKAPIMRTNYWITLDGILLETFFFKTIHSRIRTVNTDIRTPHLLVKIIRLHFVNGYFMYSRLLAEVIGTTLIVSANNWKKKIISVSKHLFSLMKTFAWGFQVLLSDKSKSLNWYDRLRYLFTC